MSKYGVFSGPYFPAFGLNTERYCITVSLRIYSEYGKIRTRKHSVFGHFSRSARYAFAQVMFRLPTLTYVFILSIKIRIENLNCSFSKLLRRS